jgi:hypothetical protein
MPTGCPTTYPFDRSAHAWSALRAGWSARMYGRTGHRIRISCREERSRRPGADAMPAKTSGWSAKLERPIVLTDGWTLLTLADVRDFILDEPEDIQERQSWQRAAGLLMSAAEDASGIEAATKQVRLALFLEARLKLR